MIAGIMAGILVGGIIVYVLYINENDEIVTNIRKQNLILHSENLQQRNVINDLKKKHLKTEEVKSSLSYDEQVI
jgi:hypothetical protein